MKQEEIIIYYTTNIWIEWEIWLISTMKEEIELDKEKRLKEVEERLMNVEISRIRMDIENICIQDIQIVQITTWNVKGQEDVQR